MIRINKNNYIIENQQGQNAIEYLLVFMLVVMVMVVALAPRGFLTRAVGKTLDISMNGVEVLVNSAW